MALCCIAAFILCIAIFCARNLGPSREASLGPQHDGDPMQHFSRQNRHEIRETKPGTWATVLFGDLETLSELSRNGFYLVEMSSDLWTLRRVGDNGVG
jgi:hypothetical protein